MGATVTDYGLLTTPQLHHIVRMANSNDATDKKWASEEGYYQMLASAYADILQVYSV
jgi:phosphoacetylglucosamine mutase